MNACWTAVWMACTVCASYAQAQEPLQEPEGEVVAPANLSCASPPCAQGAAVPPLASPAGTATRSLLQRQAEGAEASAQQYPMPGTIAHKVYERYVNSFSHAIPEHSTSAIAKAKTAK